jgi:hypothetical protein
MNEFSASDAALEGFRLTRERPGAIFAWAGVYFVGIVVMGLLMMASLGPQFIEIAKKGRFTPQDGEAVAGMLAESWPAFLLVLVVAVLLMSVLTAGIYRLVLRPQEKSLAYLRLGADEFRLTTLNLMLFAIGMVCLFTGLLASQGVEQAAPGMGVVAAAVIGALTVWVGVRLSLATPMTFATGRIAVGAAWELTRGRFWPLFGMIVLAVIFYVMVWLLTSVIGVAIGALAGGPEAMTGGDLTAVAGVAVLVTVVMQLLLSVLQVVMIYAPFAVAYQQIHGDAPAQRLSPAPGAG